MIRFEIRTLVLDSGKCPFEDWLSRMKDLKAKSVIRTRIDRVALGDFGSCRDLAGGLWELKIDFGPGYRVYFGRSGSKVILLLAGGDKGSQARDIEASRRNWQAYIKGAES